MMEKLIDKHPHAPAFLDAETVTHDIDAFCMRQTSPLNLVFVLLLFLLSPVC